jgi:hypothetical protein
MPQVFVPEQHTFHSPTYQGIVAEALAFFDKTPLYELPPPSGIVGLGVYALYYVGDFPLYAPLGVSNRPECQIPIYVGKAVPAGARTGQIMQADKSIRGRLNEHARSIQSAERHAAVNSLTNIHLADFRCRFVILDGEESDLIPGVESALIRKFTPLWNATMAGFGIHAPGKGRNAQARSEWDTIHPGRAFAARLTGSAVPEETIIAKVQATLRTL